MKLTKLVAEKKMALVRRERVGNMVVTTYIDADFNQFKFAKLVKENVTKINYEVEEEVLQESLVAEDVEEYDLEIHKFMTREYREAKKIIEQIKMEVFAKHNK